MRKDSVLGRPSLITATLGGAAGTVLAGAVLEVAPAAGATALELPVLVGGLAGGSESVGGPRGLAPLNTLGWEGHGAGRAA